MSYPATYPLHLTWLPNLRHCFRQWWTVFSPASAIQILLQVGDSYHLEAGSYRLRVQAGTIWAPGIGLFDAGEQVTLTVDVAGLALHSYAQQAAVFTVQVRG